MKELIMLRSREAVFESIPPPEGSGYQRRSLMRAGWCALLVTVVSLAGVPATSTAACPIGDPSVPYCEDFSGPNPLATYIVINPLPGAQPFTIAITNQAMVLSNTYPGLAFAQIFSGLPLDFRNTVFEADFRFDTTNPSLRSVMHLVWSTPAMDARINFGLQLDGDYAFLAWAASGTPSDERRFPWSLDPNTTYRLSLKIDEVPGTTQPKILSFEGFVNGTQVFAVTEDSLGINLSTLPAQLNPSFLGGSYSWSPVDQIFDNAIVKRQVQLACVGFEPPLDKGPVSVKKNRALPFKAQVLDAQGATVTDLGSVPPVIQIIYAPVSGPAVDVTDQAVPVGLGTVGNQFVYVDGKWRFNLQTKSYTAAGTYTVSMAPGDGYSLQPSCAGSFVLN